MSSQELAPIRERLDSPTARSPSQEFHHNLELWGHDEGDEVEERATFLAATSWKPPVLRRYEGWDSGGESSQWMMDHITTNREYQIAVRARAR